MATLREAWSTSRPERQRMRRKRPDVKRLVVAGILFLLALLWIVVGVLVDPADPRGFMEGAGPYPREAAPMPAWARVLTLAVMVLGLGLGIGLPALSRRRERKQVERDDRHDSTLK